MISKCTVSPLRAAEPADGGFARAADAATPGALWRGQLDRRAETVDRSGAQFQRRGVADEFAPLGIVGVGEERRGRHRDEIGIAVERFAVGKSELGAFDLQMDEVGAGGIETVEVEALEQRELLQHHRALAPRPGLAHRVAAVVVGQRRFDARRPARHVVGGEHAAVARSARVHHLLRAAETIDRFGDESVRPGFARPLDLGDAVAAGAFGFGQDADIGRRQRFVGEQRSGCRNRAVRQIHRRRGRPMFAEKFRDRSDGGAGAFNQRIAVLRISDRRRQHFAQRHGAVVAQQQHPGLERARHAGGKQAGAGHEVEPFARDSARWSRRPAPGPGRRSLPAWPRRTS